MFLLKLLCRALLIATAEVKLKPLNTQVCCSSITAVNSWSLCVCVCACSSRMGGAFRDRAACLPPHQEAAHQKMLSRRSLWPLPLLQNQKQPSLEPSHHSAPQVLFRECCNLREDRRICVSFQHQFCHPKGRWFLAPVLPKLRHGLLRLNPKQHFLYCMD